jgi:acetyl-CoA carboxylase carboxyl transferase subunit beta
MMATGKTEISDLPADQPSAGIPPAPARAPRPKRGVPEGLWNLCPGCQATIYRKEAEKRLNCCPECDYHFYVSAQ